MGEWKRAEFPGLLSLIVAISLMIAVPAPAQSASTESADRSTAARDETAETTNESRDDEAGATSDGAKTAEKGDGLRTTERIIVREAVIPVSPLVEAARNSRSAPEGKEPRRVFTNEDLGNAKGTMIVLETSYKREPAPEAARGPQPEAREAMIARIQKEQQAAGDRVRRASLTRQLAETREELARVEEEYYLEEQPDVRESVIEPRYQQLRDKLRELEKQLGEMGKQ